MNIPHDTEAERAVIAGLLNRPDRFEDFRTAGLEPRSFYQADLRQLFEVITSMHEAGTPIDVLSVKGKLNGSSPMSPVALLDISGAFTTIDGSLYQGRRVVELSRRRAVVELGHELARDAATDVPVEQVAEYGRLALSELEQGRDVTTDWFSTGEALRADPPPNPSPLAWYIAETNEAVIRAALRYLVVGEGGIGKTFAAMAATIEVAGGGAVALFLDWEGNLPTFVRRLHALTVGNRGFVNDPSIADRIYYRAMDDGFDPAMPLPDGTALVVIDSLAMALARAQLDENSSTDVLSFLANIERLRTKAADAAFLIIDHPGHADPGRGRGSSAKRPAIDVELTMKPTGADRAVLVVRKDRHATLGVSVGHPVAEVRRYSDGGSLGFELREPDRSTDDAGRFRPSTLMTKVADYLAGCTEGASMRAIEREVTGKRDGIRAAVACLVREECAVETPGDHGARVLTYIRHPASDPASSPPSRGDVTQRPEGDLP